MASTDRSEDNKSTAYRSGVMTAVVVGAIVGGVWGWLYLTPRGARLRDRVDPAVDRIVDALETVQGLRAAVKSLAVVILIAGFVSIPSAARAQAFVAPWIGGNVGVPSGVSPIAFGAAVGGSAAGIIDLDLEVAHSPSDGGGLGSLLTMMGDVSFGVPFGRHGGTHFRPYVSAGVGLIRSRFEGVLIGDAITRDVLGEAFGGGLAVYPTRHLGVRADLRYFHPFNFWRTSMGLVIR